MEHRLDEISLLHNAWPKHSREQDKTLEIHKLHNFRVHGNVFISEFGEQKSMGHRL